MRKTKIKKNITTKFFLAIAFSGLIIFNAQNPAVSISNSYKNNLLSVNLEKSITNDLNVTIYSSKGYAINPQAVKRANGEYLIILPETFHSITSKPDINAVKDVINDVDIKLLPYTGIKTNNGYTKIVLKTKRDDFKISVKNDIVAGAPDKEISNLVALKERQELTKKKEIKDIVFTKDALHSKEVLKVFEQAQKTEIKHNVVKNTNYKQEKLALNSSALQPEINKVVKKRGSFSDKLDEKAHQDQQLLNEEQELDAKLLLQQEDIALKDDFVEVLDEPIGVVEKTLTLMNNDKKWFYGVIASAVVLLLMLFSAFVKTISFIAGLGKGQMNSNDNFDNRPLERLNEMNNQEMTNENNSPFEKKLETNEEAINDYTPYNESSSINITQEQSSEGSTITLEEKVDIDDDIDFAEKQVNSASGEINQSYQKDQTEADHQDEIQEFTEEDLSLYEEEQEVDNEMENFDDFDDLVDEVLLPEDYDGEKKESEQYEYDEEIEDFEDPQEYEELVEVGQQIESVSQEEQEAQEDENMIDEEENVVETQGVDQDIEMAYQENKEYSQESLVPQRNVAQENYVPMQEVASSTEQRFESNVNLLELPDIEIENEPEEEPEPNVISTKEISDNKMLYLLEVGGEYSLIGMIDDSVFVLNKFEGKPLSEKINIRLNEVRGEEKIYIVQIGKWRALISTSCQAMRHILTL